MNISEVKELLAAGFTADEIRKMETPAEPETKAEPEAVPEVKAEPEAVPEVKDDAAKISDAISAAISESFKPFEDLYQKLSKLAGMPSMADVKPKGIEDIISNFFKEE